MDSVNPGDLSGLIQRPQKVTGTFCVGFITDGAEVHLVACAIALEQAVDRECWVGIKDRPAFLVGHDAEFGVKLVDPAVEVGVAGENHLLDDNLDAFLGEDAQLGAVLIDTFVHETGGFGFGKELGKHEVIHAECDEGGVGGFADDLGEKQVEGLDAHADDGDGSDAGAVGLAEEDAPVATFNDAAVSDDGDGGVGNFAGEFFDDLEAETIGGADNDGDRDGESGPEGETDENEPAPGDFPSRWGVGSEWSGVGWARG